MKKESDEMVGYLDNPHDVDPELVKPCDEAAKVRQREAQDAGEKERDSLSPYRGYKEHR